ncbi:MAG: nucleotidyltransferase domain-containing protein [Spirochaetota bacterium]
MGMRSIEDWPVSRAAERLRRRRQKRQKALEARRERAQEWARSLARELGAADSSVRQIIGFGSTFETWRNFREDSDIDLAVVGGNWFSLMRQIPEGEFEVSLIELELQPQDFIEHVRTHGDLLYERS